MKNIAFLLLLVAGLFVSANTMAQRRPRHAPPPHHSHARAHSRSAHHTPYHSGHYKNGHGSSHKGGHYRNSSTNNHYRSHRH